MHPGAYAVLNNLKLEETYDERIKLLEKIKIDNPDLDYMMFIRFMTGKLLTSGRGLPSQRSRVIPCTT